MSPAAGPGPRRPAGLNGQREEAHREPRRRTSAHLLLGAVQPGGRGERRRVGTRRATRWPQEHISAATCFNVVLIGRRNSSVHDGAADVRRPTDRAAARGAESTRFVLCATAKPATFADRECAVKRIKYHMRWSSSSSCRPRAPCARPWRRLVAREIEDEARRRRAITASAPRPAARLAGSDAWLSAARAAAGARGGRRRRPKAAARRTRSLRLAVGAESASSCGGGVRPPAPRPEGRPAATAARATSRRAGRSRRAPPAARASPFASACRRRRGPGRLLARALGPLRAPPGARRRRARRVAPTRRARPTAPPTTAACAAVPTAGWVPRAASSG